MTRPNPDPASPVVIGTLGRAHGVHGDLHARATGPTLSALPAGASVRVVREGAARDLHLDRVRVVSAGLILAFREVGTREAAQELVGGVIEVPASVLARLDDPDEFYVRDLEGCRVLTHPAEDELGVVARVHEGAANDVLEVRRPDAEALLVPFTHDAVVRLDLDERVVVVRADLLEGVDA